MKTILVTGASTGFGAQVSLLLAERGWRVFASMRNLDKSTALHEQAVALGCSDRLEYVQLDVTDPASINSAVAQVLGKTGGTIDALINNAGYSVMGAFEDQDDAACRAQMETNFFGPIAVTRALLPAMRAAGRGRIITVTSNAVNSPHPLLTMYAASKWALEGWAEGLAMELAPYGIDVCVIEPGAHRTPFASNVQFVAPEGSAYGRWIEQVMPGIASLDAWGRDPMLASVAIADAADAEALSFRILVGEDTQVFAALKAVAPYETRAFALRAITGAPAPGEYISRTQTPGAEVWPVATQVLERIGEAISKQPDAGPQLASLFRLNERGMQR